MRPDEIIEGIRADRRWRDGPGHADSTKPGGKNPLKRLRRASEIENSENEVSWKSSEEKRFQEEEVNKGVMMLIG